LIPGPGQPVSCQPNGKRAANDKTEKPRAGHCHGGWRADFVQQLNDALRRAGRFRQNTVEQVKPSHSFGQRGATPGLEALEIVDGSLGGGFEEFFHGVSEVSGMGGKIRIGPIREWRLVKAHFGCRHGQKSMTRTRTSTIVRIRRVRVND
jgi:hypothetical protein